MIDRILIAGTSIPLHEITALLPSLCVDEILEDYPSLTRKQVEDAIASAPFMTSDVRYPHTSMKRALGALVAAGVFDDVPAEPDDDFISVERQRAEKLGPDYDPHYFEKLDAWIEEQLGPLGEFEPVDS
jgi:hypothetical protein